MTKAPLIPCFFLLPERAMTECRAACAHLFDRLNAEFGGFACDHDAQRLWSERNPGFALDGRNVAVLVAMRDRRSGAETLKTIVREAANDMRVLSLYVSVGDSETNFVWADADNRTDRTKIGSVWLYLNCFKDLPVSGGRLKVRMAKGLVRSA